VLGSVIELAQALPRPLPVTDPPSARHPAVRNAVDLLGKNPTLTGKELATSVGISLSRFVRIFKSELGVSLVEYRNRLRVARIQALIDSGQHNLYDAARSAGFGSYAQFHRVFRAAYGIAPRDYLRSR
jgi:transcriptional regulator GlxA family with amidase domain